jgi:hypothetical protein
MCKDAQLSVHSNMLKNRNVSNIKQLIFGMPVAFISGTRGILELSSPTQLKKNQILNMPIQIKYVDEGIGVEFIGLGVVTGADIIAANKEIYRNENFHRQRYQIVDRTYCTKYEVSHKEIIIIAEQDKAAAITNPNIVIALISTSPLQYGISRMYQAYVGDEGFLTEVFQDRKSAEKWIEEQLITRLPDIRGRGIKDRE